MNFCHGFFRWLARPSLFYRDIATQNYKINPNSSTFFFQYERYPLCSLPWYIFAVVMLQLHRDIECKVFW